MRPFYIRIENALDWEFKDTFNWSILSVDHDDLVTSDYFFPTIDEAIADAKSWAKEHGYHIADVRLSN